jgi:hypothetical protein
MGEANAVAAATATTEHRCLACGKLFTCGLDDGGTTCWCMAEPARIAMPTTGDASCYCRECLEARLPGGA